MTDEVSTEKNEKKATLVKEQQTIYNPKSASLVKGRGTACGGGIQFIPFLPKSVQYLQPQPYLPASTKTALCAA